MSEFTNNRSELVSLDTASLERKPVGRPRKGSKRSDNPVPVVDLDLSLPPAELILPCADVTQGHHLGWRVDEVRGINKTLGLYEKLPMICHGSACFWAKQCPTKETGWLFEGLRCPIEIMEAYRNFVRYVRELDVHPDDHVDLNLIHDLVRIDLQLKHMDMRIQVQGMEVDHVAGIIQGREARPVIDKIANPFLSVQTKLRNDRQGIYNLLLASRKEKKKVEQAEGKQKLDLIAAMQRLRDDAVAKTATLREEPGRPAIPALPDDFGLITPEDEEEE
jgi:hypothetical protein